MTEPDEQLRARLAALITSSPLLMRALRVARTVDAPDWLIVAGAIRERVWNHLHCSRATPTKEIELAFHDPRPRRGYGEHRVWSAVTARATDISWEVTNHAATHLWYPRVYGHAVPALRCTADAVRESPETATAVGVRLQADDSLLLIAPHGLGDLFGLISRRNPRRIFHAQSATRVLDDPILRRWPNARIIKQPALSANTDMQDARR